MSVILSALDQVLSFVHLAYLMLGVVIGLIVGIIPGLGGIAGMSLLLPFIYLWNGSIGWIRDVNGARCRRADR